MLLGPYYLIVVYELVDVIEEYSFEELANAGQQAYHSVARHCVLRFAGFADTEDGGLFPVSREVAEAQHELKSV